MSYSFYLAGSAYKVLSLTHFVIIDAKKYPPLLPLVVTSRFLADSIGLEKEGSGTCTTTVHRSQLPHSLPWEGALSLLLDSLG